MAPLNTPSGHPTRYGAVPFRFPAATELMNVSAISDALVGRRTWQWYANGISCLALIEPKQQNSLSALSSALWQKEASTQNSRKSGTSSIWKEVLFLLQGPRGWQCSDDNSLPDEEKVVEHPTMRPWSQFLYEKISRLQNQSLVCSHDIPSLASDVGQLPVVSEVSHQIATFFECMHRVLLSTIPVKPITIRVSKTLQQMK